MLCDSPVDLTDEDVIPKWLLHAFDIQGPATVNVREEAGNPHEVRTLRHLQVTLDRGLCKKCNNELLGGLEQAVQPVLGAMAVQRAPTTLNLASQRLLAVWAIKTVFLLELAVRQRYQGARLVGGYQPSRSEIGWLLAQLEQRPAKLVEPPPRSMVWLSCWDCMAPGATKRGSMVNYAPSTALLPTRDGSSVVSQFATLAIGSAVLQVFTVDFVEAEARKGVVWNPDPPDSIANAIPVIWPHRLRAGDIAWPPPAFPNDSFGRLVNWDAALRGTAS